MMQNYSTIHNHKCLNEKKYKLILNPIIRSTLKIKNTNLDERGGAEIPPVGSIKYLTICKVYELETS